jgi:mono/diheme cytochrome c family protein
LAILFFSVSTAFAADTEGIAFFEKHIRPLFIDHCQKCHDGTQNKSKGGLTLDTRAGWEKGGDSGKAIIPGKPDESLLYQVIAFTHAEIQMPPKKDGGKLPDEKIAAVKQWIAMGAPDPRDGKSTKLTGLTAEARAHWAYQPVQPVAVPVVKDPWIRNEVDAFVFAKLREQGLKPNAIADKPTLIRRVTYDLIGLPPTPQEIADFVADRSPEAFAKVVDRLLASPHYGERWGRHWLDSARYSDTIGLKSNGGKYRWEDYRLRSAWTYRDYVVKAFNDDKPWNDFLIEQLAADQLPDRSAQDPRLAALGFITVGKRFDNVDDMIDERIDTVSKAMLGVTVSCTRCHDHKFDPISTADYYALHGIFNNIEESYDLPELPRARDPAQIADYEKRLATLTQENRTQYYAIVRKRLDHFHEKAEGYLRLAVVNGRSPERQQLAEQYGLHPENRDEIREVINALNLRTEHPVVGPFARLSRITAEQFAEKAPAAITAALTDKKNPVNPLVAAALKDLKPQSLAEVATLYAGLFAKAVADAPTHLDTLTTLGQPPAATDAALAELLVYPYNIPDADDLVTAEQQMAQFQRVQLEQKSIGELRFTAINHLRLTHPGSPGWALTVADKSKVVDSYVYLRGEKAKKGPVVARSFLEVLSGGQRKPFTHGSGRLELAKAIADPANPLTARVVVNRAWMHHLGEGFVPTPDDMGVMSEKPVHRELLDWLSAQFVADGWSLKRLHRRILLSATYQQSAASNAAFDAKDPDNRLYWRANLRRLDVESIRDSLVQLSGRLDRTVGGQPVNISDEPYSYRRTIYGFVDRLALSDLMIQFDYADPEMPNSRRTNTTVPQQALFFLNSPMAADAARSLMARADITGAADDTQRVQALYRALFQRDANEAEVALALGFIAETSKPEFIKAKAAAKPSAPKDTGDKNKYSGLTNAGTMVERAPLKPWELYAQALICSNEFVYVN